MKTEERLTVNLGSRSYRIVVGANNLGELGPALQALDLGNSIFIVTTPRIAGLYAQLLIDKLASAGFPKSDIYLAQVPEGEEHKSSDEWLNLLHELMEFDRELTRHILVLNLGGGMIGDLGGFVAATYRRGVAYVQVPTTLLADVDSALGGKVGIDFGNAKNLVGAFYQPRLVWLELDFLQTLGERELRSGIAEIVKYGVIAEPELFAYLEEHYQQVLAKDVVALRSAILPSARVKAQMIEQDELDNLGIRVKLNFGHTVGHAIEAAAGYTRYTHGEAISIGMVCAGEIARALGMFSQEELGRLERLLTTFGLPVRISQVDFEKAWESLLHDKKFIRGENRFVLPVKIGAVEVRSDVPHELIRQVITSRMSE